MDGGKFQQLVGSRRQVFNGTAKKTNYGKNGLEKKDLKMNKHGLIVSAKKSKTAKKAKHLGKFLQKRGSKTFGPRKTAKKTKGGDLVKLSEEEFKSLNQPWTYEDHKTIETLRAQDMAKFKQMQEGMTNEDIENQKEQEFKDIEKKNEEKAEAQKKEAEEKTNAAREFQQMADKAAEAAEAAKEPSEEPSEEPPKEPSEGGKKKKSKKH
tara:strand:+ start:400 stop:1026 length:627 start_codon:yes stop_codon:yes gene_type:complete